MSATGISAFHVSGCSKAKGNGDVFIDSPKDAVSSGIFHIEIDVHFDLGGDEYYPASLLSIKLRGCRYWVMLINNIRDNKGTRDIVRLYTQDRNSNRVAYSTEPLKGDIEVATN